jgi:hypothetical protein
MNEIDAVVGAQIDLLESQRALRPLDAPCPRHHQAMLRIDPALPSMLVLAEAPGLAVRGERVL